MELEDDDLYIRSAADIARDLRRIGDQLDHDPAFQRLISNVASTSLVGRQYTIFASLIREFVMLVARRTNVPVDLVKRIIRIFLYMWNNQELTRQIVQELHLETSVDIADDISETSKAMSKILVAEGPVDIPQEVQLMNDDFIRQYHKALGYGMERVKSIRLMVVGMFGVGKTSLVENLVETVESCKLKTDLERTVESTVGIDVRHCAIKEDGKWVEDLFHFDPNERLLEVITSPTSDVPNSAVDMVDSGSKENVGSEKILYDRKAWRNRQMDQDKQKSNKTMSCDDDFSAFKESLLSRDEDPQFNVFIRNIMSVLNDPAKVEPSSQTVSIWDFAGQYIYYSTHHFFLNSRSIYLLLMDVSRSLSSLVKEKSDFPLSGFLHKDFTCLEAFKFWLNSIHMYSSQQGHETDVQPTVILVGTHKDKLTGNEEEKEKQKEDYFNEALKSYIDSPVLAHVHRKKFLINNLDCKEDFGKIRAEVEGLAQKQKYWGETRPAKWIPLERAFLGFKSEGKEIISFDDVKKAGQMSDLRIESEAELRLFLRFQHSLGNILYYETNLLRNYVILSPQWIIDAFRCFVTHVPDKNPLQLKLWEDFEKKAILTAELIDEIIDNNEKNKYFKDYKIEVIEYMEYLDMIARPMNEKYGTGKATCVESDCPVTPKERPLLLDLNEGEELETDFIGVQIRTPKQDGFQQVTDTSPNGQKTNMSGASLESLSRCNINTSACLTRLDFYIVPSLLQAKPNKIEISRLISPSCEKTSILCMKFRDGFMPPSVFHRLLAICIRKYQIVSQNGQYLLFNGLGVFRIAKTSTLCIWFHDNIIYARVAFYDKKQPSLAQDMRHFLVQNLTEILRILPNESRINEFMPFEEYIQCSSVSTFEPGIGLMRMRDFLYENALMCEHPELHSVTKYDAIGYWCYESIQKQKDSAIPDAILKRQPSEKELGRIARGIGSEYFQLGLELKLSSATLQQIRDADRFHLPTRIYHMLHACKNETFTVEYLRNAMIAADSDVETFDCVFSDSFSQSKELKGDEIDLKRKPSLEELSTLADGIGDEYWLLGVELGIKESRIQHLRMDHQSVPKVVYNILIEWCKGDVSIWELGKAMLIVRADIAMFYNVFKS